MNHRRELIFGVMLVLSLVAVLFIARRHRQLYQQLNTRLQETHTAISSVAPGMVDPYYAFYLPDGRAIGAIPEWPKLGWMPKVRGGFLYVTARDMSGATFTLPDSKVGISAILLSVSKREKRSPCLIVNYNNGGKRSLFSGEWPSRGDTCEEGPALLSRQPVDRRERLE